MSTYSVLEIEITTSKQYTIGTYTDEAKALQFAYDVATDVASDLTANLGQECSTYDDIDHEILKTIEGRIGTNYGVLVNDTEEIRVIVCVTKSQ
jgi:hypothetical protein